MKKQGTCFEMQRKARKDLPHLQRHFCDEDKSQSIHQLYFYPQARLRQREGVRTAFSTCQTLFPLSPSQLIWADLLPDTPFLSRPQLTWGDLLPDTLFYPLPSYHGKIYCLTPFSIPCPANMGRFSV
jgi:hypothetical protein